MLSISEVAERTGFTPATLRFYDEIGLVKPAGRTGAGYRRYDDGSLEQLRFVKRAKHLGLSLDEVREIAALIDDDTCAPVQARWRSLLADKIVDTRRRTTETIALLGQLQTVAARMDGYAPNGPCDDECGCVTDPPASVAVALSTAPSVTTADPIACTLHPSDLSERIESWQSALTEATDREEIDGGVRVVLPRSTDLAALALLVAAEQTCCSFLTFDIRVTRDHVTLDVTAPADGIPIVHALVGPGS